MPEVKEIISKSAVDGIKETDKWIKITDKDLKILIGTIEKNIKVVNDNKTTIDSLNKARKESKKTSKEIDVVGKQLAQTEAKLKQLEDQRSKTIVKNKVDIAARNKELKTAIVLEDKQAGTLQKLAAANAKLRTEREKLNLTTKDGKKRLIEINTEIDKNNKKIVESSDAAKQQSANVGNYGSAMTGLLGPIRAVSAALKALLLNPVVAVFAAIVAVFTLLIKAMQRSEAGQDRLNKVMQVASSIWDNVMDILTLIGIALFDTFPKMLSVVGNKFQIFALNMKLGFLRAQIALATLLGQGEKVARLTTEFNKAESGVETLKNETKELTDSISAGFSEAGEKMRNFGKEVEDDIKRAVALAKLIADTNKEERRQIVENSKIARDSAKLRGDAELLKRVDAVESIRLMEESFALDEKILANELKLATARRDIATETSALAVDSIEFKKEIADAEAEVFNIETKFNDLRAGRIRKLNQLRKQAFKQDQERLKANLEEEKFNAEAIIAINESVIENEAKSLEDRKKAVLENQKILADLAEKEFQLELAALQNEKDLKIKNEAAFTAEITALNAKRNSEKIQAEQEAFDEITDITQDHQDATTEATQRNTERELELKIAHAEATIENEELLQNTIFELRKAALEQKLIDLEADILLEEEGSLRRLDLEEEFLDARLELELNAVEAEEAIEERRRMAKQTTFDFLIGLAGKETALGKVLLAAKILLNRKETALAISTVWKNAAIANQKAIAASPLTFGLPWTVINRVAALANIGLILKNQVKGFVKGTFGKSDTPSEFITSEDGKKEWIEKGGRLIETTQPTLHTGAANSRVYSNPEVNRIMGASRESGFNSAQLIASINANGLKQEAAINNIKTHIFNNDGTYYGFKQGNYKRNYVKYN